jgi:aryl-alcohol dehydrogenase-like predicted oxidoreductase
MRYRSLGRSGPKVSELCLGTMTFGGQVDEATSQRIFEAALDGGINFFDTANIYNKGLSERIVGSALKGRRDRVIVATKVRARMGDDPSDEGLSRKHIFKAVEDSLSRLGSDYVDLYYAHWPDDAVLLEETLRSFDDLVRQGKVRYVGLSNFPAWQTCKALWLSDVHDLARVAAVQPHFNLLHRVMEHELLPLCQEEEIGVAVYSPLAGGALTGKYSRGQVPPGTRAARSADFAGRVLTERNLHLIDELTSLAEEGGLSLAQLALAWVVGKSGVTSAVIGATSPAQLQETLKAADVSLDRRLARRADEATTASA